jgi:hypothetical protein
MQSFFWVCQTLSLDYLAYRRKRITERKHPMATNESFSKTNEERRDEPPALEGLGSEVSTRITYSLRFTGWPNLSQLVAVAVATATYTVLSYLTLTYIPTPIRGLSTIFFPIIFGLPFALWFGGWAVVVAYIGNCVGAGLLAGLSLPTSLAGGAADLIQLVIPMILYRLLAPSFGVSSIGKDVLTVKGFLFYAIVGVLPWNIIGGLYGTFILIAFGVAPAESFLLSWGTWSISNVLLLLIIGPIILSQMGPVVERAGLTVHDALR